MSFCSDDHGEEEGDECEDEPGDGELLNLRIVKM